MATIVLGSIGATLGGSLGGSFMGLSAMAIGRAVGATVGRAIDQRIMGGGADAVETGRMDRLRLSSAAEGVPIPRVVGRYRLGGQIIWASPYVEHHQTHGGGGKGAPSQPEVREYSYSASVAVAICEGVVSRVGRLWADGVEVPLDTVEMRVYPGSEDQLPDPVISAYEEAAPAYRGVCYVVFEDLDLSAFGNRVPHFSFEVVRPVRSDPDDVPLPVDLVRGAALIPGTGEHALATEVATVREGPGAYRALNANGMTGESDFSASLRDLKDEVTSLRSTTLVVSWFGDDLRCGSCSLQPLVEKGRPEAEKMPWAVAGQTRSTASAMPLRDGRVIYGGTPTDASVVQAIRAMAADGIDVTFYPFTLMTPMAGNGLPDPWGQAEQPALPWRGRITCMPAPGRDGTVDGTAAAEAQVAAFFGTAGAADFVVGEGTVSYAGPDEWSYRRFILHYAALCAAAGGVEAFCIGSEMRSLTQVRGRGGAFPAVSALRALAREVRALLPTAQIGYAADWSEYSGYQPPEGGGAFHFHLDPLWADEEIDFVGIDNYMPLSDWRSGDDHADAGWGACHDLGYLMSNVEGGEGYDWYYPTAEARAAQRREPIVDGAHDEPWVWRYKDIRSWWSTNHFDRPGGVRADVATAWVPGSKPIRFTEYGCPAVHLGTNQPNVFVDPHSSEGAVPHHSDGTRDDAIQMQYVRALLGYWGAKGRNPKSPLDGRRMIDLAHSAIWAWDTRPFPAFPSNGALWADAPNWDRGHWWSGRSSAQPLSGVIAELCRAAGIAHFDVSRVYGVVRGQALRDVASARADLQPLLLVHGVDAVEVGGILRFVMRAAARHQELIDELAVRREGGPVSVERDGPLDVSGRVRVHHVDADGDFASRVGDAVHPGSASVPVHDSEFDMALTADEGQGLAERFLAEARIARDRLSVELAPSRRGVGVGDLLRRGTETWRVDRIVEGTGRAVEAVRADPSVYRTAKAGATTRVPIAPSLRAGMVDVVVLDLPLLRGDEVPHAPHVAAVATPWQGPVAVHGSFGVAGFALDTVLRRPVGAGVLKTDLWAAPSDLWDEGTAVEVEMVSGTLESAVADRVLSGANAVAIGSGAPHDWEIVQFREAVLVAPRRWSLRGRLRGQRGTEDRIRSVRPAGSWLILLEGPEAQLPTAPEHLGRERALRYGPARFAPDHATYQNASVRLKGRGLRPYAPAHLSAIRRADGVAVSWVRRTRLGGDRWDDGDVPLGEARERYRVRVLEGTAVVSTTMTDVPGVVLSSDDVPSGARIEVAQMADLVTGVSARTSVV